MAPQARLEAGIALAPLAHAVTDVSDGLVAELREFARFGGVGCRIREDALPIDWATHELAAAEGITVTDWAYWGGEDYELLAAVPASRVSEAKDRLADAGVIVAEIGVVTDEPGLWAVSRDGERRLDERREFNHFLAHPL
jgi:thiamine-monophosphate kinase